MNTNDVFAIIFLVCFVAILLAGPLLKTNRQSNWTKMLRWNIEGLFDALRRRRYK